MSKTVTIEIEEGTHRKFKARCASEGVTLREIFSALAEAWAAGKVELPGKPERAKKPAKPGLRA